MNRFRQGALLVLALALCGTGVDAETRPALRGQPGQLELLQSIQAVRSLSPSEAARAHPVRLRATVAFYDPSIGSDVATLFIHDATGGIFLVVPATPTLPLHEGTVIDILGVSGAGDFAPVITKTALKVVGQARMPSQAPLVMLNQLMTGGLDSQWVQFEGVVHALHPQGNNMVLKLATGAGSIFATLIREPGVDYTKLIGAHVRTFAVVGSRFNKRRQFAGVHLFLSAIRDLKVLQYGSQNPFALPTQAIRELSGFAMGTRVTDQVHLRGAVTLQRPGQLLCIEDATGGLCADTLDTTPLAIGSVADVVGFRSFEEGSPKLIDAMYRTVRSYGQPPPAIPIKATEALLGGHSGDLVELQGEITGLNGDPREPSALVASDGLVFSVLLPPGLAISDPNWRKGSRVRVRGICTSIPSRQRFDERQGRESYAGFRLLLRSPDDLTVERRPSWWTPLHTILTLSVALATTMGALAWALMLHRRVRLQAGMLQESERRYRHLAYHDPLTGLPNRTLLQLRLSAAIDLSESMPCCPALLMLDLDGFKQVNDQLGHDAGDVVLRAVADRLRRVVREPDVVARMGGDEFVVLLLGSQDTSDACACAERILRSFQSPVEIGAESTSLSCSIGVGVFDPRVDDVKSFFKKVDAAMYEAKAGGKDQFRVCTEDRSGDLLRLVRDVERLSQARFMTGALG